MKTARALRGVSVGLLLAVLALAALTLRAVTEGESQMRQSDASFHAADLPKSLLHARAAAVMYAPGAPHVRRGYERMIAIALGAEAAGQRRMAEAAWRSVRGAALETRHVWVPQRAELARADDNLARLATLSDEPNLESKLALARAKAELVRDDAPAPLFVVALVLGFAFALAGLFTLGFKGVTPKGELVLGRAKLGLALSLFGSLLWTYAVWKA